MRVFIIASEAVPYAKTGGLADVTGALLKEFIKAGMDARLIMPFYSVVAESFKCSDTGIRLSLNILSEKIEAQILESSNREYPAYFVRCDRFFMRRALYGDPSGDYYDNALRFSFFSRIGLQTIKALSVETEIIHLHDRQTALVPFYLRNFHRGDSFWQRTKTVLTIHNLGYQGLFAPTLLPYIGIGFEHFVPEGIEFYGKINFLKAGIISSDAVTTVSENYAREILTPEYGAGLDGVLRSRSLRLYGILNGIDYSLWNPETDRALPARYSLKDLRGKKICKEALIKELNLKIKSPDPLIGYVGRLAAQKGIDLIVEAIPDIIKAGFGIIMLGSGDKGLEEFLLKRSSQFKDRLCVHTGYDENLARKVYGGSDIFIMPSRYEPCGLTQMIAMRYGTIPVARDTGGLRDTIEDYDHLNGRGSGFLFRDYNPSTMTECLKRVLCLFKNPRGWSKVMKEAMTKDFSWKNSAQGYMRLFKSLITEG